MAFTHYRHKKEQRQILKKSRIDDIIVFDEDLPKECKFTFVDFAATQKYIENEGIKSAKYSEILKFANQWLKKYDYWEVLGCETIPAIVQLYINESGQILSKQILITFLISEDLTCENDIRMSSNEANYQVLLLRFYLKRVERHPRNDKYERVVQQIRYTDFAPQIINQKKEFETIDEVVKRVNQSIKSEEITGKIINIQTLSCSVGQDWSFDSENTKPMNLIGKIIYILRIFYELGPTHEEEIGLADFVPQCLSGGNLLKRPKFESQYTLRERASKWLSENPEINFCSALSFDVKLKSMISINTRHMSYTRDTGDYIRILRIAYTKPQELPLDIPLSSSLPPPPPIYLECKTFPIYKSYSEVKRTIAEFFSRDEWSAEERYRWCFLNWETVFIFAANKRAIESNVNQSFQAVSFSKSSINTVMFYAIKAYYDVGFYGIDHNQDSKKCEEKEKDDSNNKRETNSCDLM